MLGCHYLHKGFAKAEETGNRVVVSEIAGVKIVFSRFG